MLLTSSKLLVFTMAYCQKIECYKCALIHTVSEYEEAELNRIEFNYNTKISGTCSNLFEYQYPNTLNLCSEIALEILIAV